ADYAVLTCQTAYLKAHYPAEYYTALLTVQRDVMEDVILFTSDCRRLGIPILPPSVNASELDFTIEPTADGKRGIRYGLGAVKNAGEKAVQHIIKAREAGGPFHDLTELCQRVDLRPVGKRAVESLIKVGAFDELGDRDEMLVGLERITKFSADYHHAIEIGQMSLFGGATSTPDTLEMPHLSEDQRHPTRERLRWEKDLIGLYVSQHPLNAVMGVITRLANIAYSETLKQEADQMSGKPVTVAGLIVGVRQITTKRNEVMAIVTLEDVEGVLDCVLFPRTWTQYKGLIRDDALVILRGKADASRGDMQIIVESVSQQFEVTSAADEEAEIHLDFGYRVPAARPPSEPEPPPPPEDAFIPKDADVSPEDGAAGDRWDFAEEEESVSSPQPRRITLRIRRTTDPRADQRLIRRIHGLLIQRPGIDHFRFVLVGAPYEVAINFEQCIQFDDDLEREIVAIVGPGAVKVTPLPPPDADDEPQ
ncbi:MAG TPA: OB-fold nucleic acid binding domain-containing protein, partial [Aggregatilineales bacterium]|nr:OB-fold nucleic acid binding domain-containing protein [Aggregatilineales bacterium]